MTTRHVNTVITVNEKRDAISIYNYTVFSSAPVFATTYLGINPWRMAVRVLMTNQKSDLVTIVDEEFS